MVEKMAPFLLLALLVGCGSPPPAVDWRAEAVSVDYPEPYQRLYLRDVSVGDTAAIDTRAPAGERYLLDRSVAREVVKQALSSLGIFKRVDDLASANERPADDGLIVDLALDDAALVHTGETGSTGFWLWLFTGFPGLCVHDQLYTAFYDPHVRVCDARSGDTLVPWEPLAAPTGESYALDFHERTTGFWPYVECWVIPPTSIGIDEAEVARKVLPPSLRPTMQSLVRIFNQITFAPVNKVEAQSRPCMGVRLDDVSTTVKGGVADVTVHATLAPGAWISFASCGDVRVDLSSLRASQLEKPIEFVLADVPIVPGDSLDVLVGMAGQQQPQRLVTLTCTSSGELRPDWHRETPRKALPAPPAPPSARSEQPIPAPPPSPRTDEPAPAPAPASAPPSKKIQVDVHDEQR